MNPERLFLIDCPIDNAGIEEVLALINEKIEKNEGFYICGINVQICIDVLRNKSYLDKIKLFHLIPDSKWIVIGSRILGTKLKGQIRTPDFARATLEFCKKKKFNVFLLGAKKEVLKKCVNSIKKEYQNINIVGYHDGYFSLDKNDIIVNNINKSGADILFIGIPSPMKEDFIIKNIGKLKPIVSLGVGGLFDIFGGKTKEAPKNVQKIGMEWFYRLIQEPRRLWKRYLFTNTLFIYLVFKEKLKMIFKNFIHAIFCL